MIAVHRLVAAQLRCLPSLVAHTIDGKVSNFGQSFQMSSSRQPAALLSIAHLTEVLHILLLPTVTSVYIIP
jgi:hypothetical protein